MQLSVNSHMILGIVTLEKVLEAILNMSILDEKDAEKIRNLSNKSVTVREIDENTGYFNEET